MLTLEKRKGLSHQSSAYSGDYKKKNRKTISKISEMKIWYLKEKSNKINKSQLESDRSVEKTQITPITTPIATEQII